MATRFLGRLKLRFALSVTLSIIVMGAMYKGWKLYIVHPSCEVAYNRTRAVFQKLLTHWIQLANASNVTYVLSTGTLLGQYRHQDFIPWDSDADVLVKDTDYDKIKNMPGSARDFIQGNDALFHMAVQPDYEMHDYPNMRYLTCNNKVVPRQTDECSFKGPMARLLQRSCYLDIFGIRIKDGIAYEHYKKKYLKEADLFPPKDCYFMGIITKCPRNSRNILLQYYSSLEEPSRECVNGKWLSKARRLAHPKKVVSKKV